MAIRKRKGLITPNRYKYDGDKQIKPTLYVKTNGKKEVFLSGGRFDNLIKDLGNKKDLNAVGAAINRSIL